MEATDTPPMPTPAGATYVHTLDADRLNRQQAEVFALMRDGTWRTLAEISAATHNPEASVSARLRDFRRLGQTVERRRRGDPRAGLHEYRVVLR